MQLHYRRLSGKAGTFREIGVVYNESVAAQLGPPMKFMLETCTRFPAQEGLPLESKRWHAWTFVDCIT